MDIGLFLAVLWRSKRLMLSGVLLGTALAILAYGRPALSNGRPTLVPHTAKVWQSEAQLLITQTGFPMGRAGFSGLDSLAALSPVYANLANGDGVLPEVARRLGIDGTVQATDSLEPAAGVTLPFVNLTATAPTSREVVELVGQAARSLQSYVTILQGTAKIPPAQRIELSIVKSGTSTKLIDGPKISISILVFVAVLIACMSLVFLKENLMPRVARELGRVPTHAELQELRPEVTRGPHGQEAPIGAGLEIAREPVALSDKLHQ